MSRPSGRLIRGSKEKPRKRRGGKVSAVALREWLNLSFGTVSIVLVLLNFYCDLSNRSVDREIRIETLIDNAWDYLGGKEGKARPGTHYVRLGSSDSTQIVLAERSIREALSIDPHHVGARLAEAVIYNQRGHFDQAVSRVQQILEESPEWPAAQRTYGLALLGVGSYDEAEAVFRKMLNRFPEAADVHHLLGTSLRFQRRDEEAILSMEMAVKLRSTDPEVHNDYALLLRERGELDQAREALQRAIVLDPEYADGYLNLGTVLMDLKEMDAAQSAYSMAIELAPGDWGAVNNLGAVLRAQGNLAGATDAFQKAILLAPEEPAAHYNLAEVLQARGEDEKAQKHANKARKLLEVRAIGKSVNEFMGQR